VVFAHGNHQPLENSTAGYLYHCQLLASANTRPSIWFNTDMNTLTGMNVCGNKLIGAEDYIFFENSDLPVIHNRVLDYAYNGTHDTTIEIAFPVELTGSATFEAYFTMHPGRYWGTTLSGPGFSFTVPGSLLPEPPLLNVAPVITSNGGRDSAGILIAENNTAVMSVTATDANIGQTLTCAITGGADASIFAINATTGTLSFRVAQDFEAPTDADGNNIYNLIVGVYDGNGRSDSQEIALTVINVDGVNVLGSSYGQMHTGTGESDTFSGSGGNGTFNGLGGNDTLNGDAGNDVITDFVSGSDKIDVSAIDNNVNAAGNGAFTFLAAAGAAFTRLLGRSTPLRHIQGHRTYNHRGQQQPVSGAGVPNRSCWSCQFRGNGFHFVGG
jgi:hypothetical protein